MNSELIGMAYCRFHNDKTPSMAVYENFKGHYSWYSFYCFGCSASGRIPKREVASWLAGCALMSSGNREEREVKAQDIWRGTERLHDDPEHEEPSTFLHDRFITIEHANKCGIRYHAEYNALVWQGRRTDGGAQEMQVRFISPGGGQKKILTYPVPTEKDIYPLHAVMPWSFFGAGYRTLIVSESFLDGVALNLHTGCYVFTTLSSNFNQRHVGIINMIASKHGYTQIVLAYDMDEAGLKAETHMARFLLALNYKVIKMSQVLTDTKLCFILKPYHRVYVEAVRGVSCNTK